MSPGEDDRDATLQLMIALGRAYRALERGVRPQLAERGLGLSEFAVLEVLYHRGPLTLGEIRDRILVTGASTTYVVKKLEERGMVRRAAGARDQRIVVGELTQKGRALIADVFPDHEEQLRGLMSGLSVADKHAATALLRRLAAGASAQR
jgi:MarR family 2-MHQ and catechol resistance regulon transcriptional repressor